jgi:hypothetical protein
MDIKGAHVLYVMGKRRSGKSFTLGAIAEGLVSQSWLRQGAREQAVLILDTMNVFLTLPFAVSDAELSSSSVIQNVQRWRLASERPNAILFAPRDTARPAGVNINPFMVQASDLAVEEWCSLFDLDPFADPMGHLITVLHAKVAREGVVDKATGDVTPPLDAFGLDELLAALDRDRDIDSFSVDTRSALRRRLETTARTPLFGSQPVNMNTLLRPGQISVILLRDLEPEVRAVIVALITKRLMQGRAQAEQYERLIPVHRARAENFRESDPIASARELALAENCVEQAALGLPRAWLIIDEAHNYVPARQRPASRKPLKKYVDEGRNLGLSIVVATQEPAGLDPSLQRNADMLLVHALSHHDDIAAAQGMLNAALPDEIIIDNRRFSGSRAFEAAVRQLPLGYAFLSTDRASRIFPLQVRPRVSVHGGADY